MEVEREFAAALSLKPEDARVWQTVIGFWRRAEEIERAESLCFRARSEGMVAHLQEMCASR